MVMVSLLACSAAPDHGTSSSATDVDVDADADADVDADTDTDTDTADTAGAVSADTCGLPVDLSALALDYSLVAGEGLDLVEHRRLCLHGAGLVSGEISRVHLSTEGLVCHEVYPVVSSALLSPPERGDVCHVLVFGPPSVVAGGCPGLDLGGPLGFDRLCADLGLEVWVSDGTDGWEPQSASSVSFSFLPVEGTALDWDLRDERDLGVIVWP